MVKHFSATKTRYEVLYHFHPQIKSWKGASDLKSEEIVHRQSNEENVKPKIFVLLTTETFLQSKNVDHIFVDYI